MADTDAGLILRKTGHQLKSFRNAEHFFYFVKIHLLKAGEADVDYARADPLGNERILVFDGAVTDPTATLHSTACLRTSQSMDPGITAFFTQSDITSFVHNVDAY